MELPLQLWIFSCISITWSLPEATIRMCPINKGCPPPQRMSWTGSGEAAHPMRSRWGRRRFQSPWWCETSHPDQSNQRNSCTNCAENCLKRSYWSSVELPSGQRWIIKQLFIVKVQIITMLFNLNMPWLSGGRIINSTCASVQLKCFITLIQSSAPTFIQRTHTVNCVCWCHLRCPHQALARKRRSMGLAGMSRVRVLGSTASAPSRSWTS